MTDEQWDAIALLLDKGFKWREPFGGAQLTAYRLLLDGYDEEQIAGALRTLVARGQVFGPTPGELVEVMRHDPSRPTFTEAYRLIYGRGGLLWTRGVRIDDVHPLLQSFVGRYGLDRLRLLEVDHDDYGDLKRRELESQWDAHCEAMEGRDVAALALSRSDRGSLGRLDPLAALGIGQQPQLKEGQ